MKNNGFDRNAAPLYVQARTLILERIEAGTYGPGKVLPSEFALADELGISQGTVRKALDTLVADRFLVRRQGRGTFVADHTPADVLFRFFKFYTRDGERVLPSSRDTRVRHRIANASECARLQLECGSRIISITRTRLHGRTPVIREKIALPAETFPGLGANGTVPNTLYDLFQHQYGITVTHASERIEPAAASARDAAHLGLAAGSPLLRIDRLTFGLGKQPIEWRVSLCHLKGVYYLSELR
ncbi:MAG: GntR family transcriptional regulator [Alphaproteobacteria bacterium]|nr:GntR family transcriptional regulator [Alphaproteobacteria bacterium]